MRSKTGYNVILPGNLEEKTLPKEEADNMKKQLNKPQNACSFNYGPSNTAKF